MHGVSDFESTPVCGIDLWEHAYFFNFKGDKSAYVDSWFKMIHWDKVSTAFETYNLENQVISLLDWSDKFLTNR